MRLRDRTERCELLSPPLSGLVWPATMKVREVGVTVNQT